MPLWKIYHPENAFSVQDKHALSQAITALYSRLPKFYVGVVFQPVPADSFFVGGEPADNFVRIWVDHIARTLPTPEAKAWWIKACDDAMAPYIRDRGFDWEFHIDETPFDLWSIQGLRPPPANSDAEARWISENKASPYDLPAA
ncbi:tautomerase family protein [Phenylobacterium sp. 20VBR1]|uniref:Tautomerase family protein n=1 Tax=Phenylobacterium glaciei TaxID=2803784 RepID=A0A941D6I9_9CAUL|nr:tautomerase family protein [Phenylobacterium glaciei]MBR7621053.1 tautomerase family protein [Phenylobacterium glaciei]